MRSALVFVLVIVGAVLVFWPGIILKVVNTIVKTIEKHQNNISILVGIVVFAIVLAGFYAALYVFFPETLKKIIAALGKAMKVIKRVIAIIIFVAFILFILLLL